MTGNPCYQESSAFFSSTIKIVWKVIIKTAFFLHLPNRI
jgi:hypothetical protein